MSTKSTIRWAAKTESTEGFHLYTDVIDEMQMGEQAPIYLELEGVQVCLETSRTGGALLRVELSKEIARRLGLLTPSP